MNVAGVDLKELFDFFWQNKSRNKLFLSWSGIGLLIVLFMAFFMAISFAGPYILKSQVVFSIVYFVVYIIFMIVNTGVSMFNMGTGIQVYDDLFNNTDPDFEVGREVKSKLWLGFKLFVGQIFYSIPFVLGLFILFFLGFILSEVVGSSYLNLVLLLCGYVLILVFSLGVGFILNYLVRPVCIRLIQQKNAKGMFNVGKVIAEIKTRKSDYLKFGFISFVIMIMWTIVYMITYFLSYLLIGLFLLPFVFGLMYIYMAYVEPKLLHIIFDKK